MKKYLIWIFISTYSIIYGQNLFENDLLLGKFSVIEIHQNRFQGNYIKMSPSGLVCRKIISEKEDSVILIRYKDIKQSSVEKVVKYIEKEKLNIDYPNLIIDKNTPTSIEYSYFVFLESVRNYKCIIDLKKEKKFITLIKLLNGVLPKKYRPFFDLKMFNI